MVPGLLCVGIAGIYRPWLYDRGSVPRIDRWLAICLLAIVVQLIPLPPALLDVVSPAVRPTVAELSLVVPSHLALSIDPSDTATALVRAAALVVVFLSARRIFSLGGVRLFARGVALIGLLLSAVALAQDATGHGLMYWRWKPLLEGGPPFGPFVNRNHFATWALLAVPLTLGYLLAHAGAHARRPGAFVPLRRRIVLFFDGRAILLTAAVCAMVVALFATLSRSGMLGLASAFVVGLMVRSVRRGAESTHGRRWLAAALLGAGALVVAQVGLSSLAARLANAQVSAGERLLIWRDTLPMVRDFWLTGTGAGTYETAMLVYQRSSPGVRFNQAHNHYLQILAEGGALLAVPVFVALVLYTRGAWARLRHDGSGMFWIRAGAFCGLAGAAAQSVWETGLATPANAALAAVLAAIVTHEPERLR